MPRLLIALILVLIAVPAVGQQPRPPEFPIFQRPGRFPQLPPPVNVGTFADVPKQNWKVIFVDSQDPKNPAALAIDGDAATLWATQWETAQPPYPHEIQIDMGAVYAVTGFSYTPRQDGITSGSALNWEFYISSDGKTWGTPFLSGTFSNDSSKKSFTSPTTTAARYIRLRGLGEMNGGPWMVVAEIDVIEGTLPQYVTISVLPQFGDKNTFEPLASRTTPLTPVSPLCNLPFVPPPSEPAVINPTWAYFDDPFHANKLCRAELPRDIPISDTERVVAVFRANPPVVGDPELVSTRSNVAIPQPWFRAGLPPPATPTSVRILP